jgi:hypothetical protein
MPEYNGEEPAREPVQDRRYTFKGWTPEVKPVAADATYTADFETIWLSSIESYKIYFTEESFVFDGTAKEYPA